MLEGGMKGAWVVPRVARVSRTAHPLRLRYFSLTMLADGHPMACVQKDVSAARTVSGNATPDLANKNTQVRARYADPRCSILAHEGARR